MKKSLALITGLTCFCTANAQESYFMGRFNTAKSYLSEGKTSEAMPVFEELIKEDPGNSNLHYLLGVCYTEESIVSDKSVYHLEKAMKNVVLDYDPSSFRERRTPVFVYYFLVVAYSQNGMCEKTKEANHYFVSVYGGEKNDFYIKDAENWARKCREKQESPRVIKAIELPGKVQHKEEILTKSVEYTTASALYGVQVAALSKLVPVYDFNNLKNTEAFMDKSGIIRYVIGHFSIKKQAETLLVAIREAGYPDAFIVDVNKEKKFSEEVISVDNQSIKKKVVLREKYDYKVQLGAFRDSIPGSLARKYLEVNGIEELMQDDLTILTSGKFSNYDEAAEYREEMLNLGISGAFVVAFNGDRKVAVVRRNAK